MKKILLYSVFTLLLQMNLGSAMAQAPSLGAASGFVLFSTIGAVGNIGNSILTGNVGTNNGAITGFGNVNGTMHNANGTTFQAGADLLLAYNQLNSAIPTFFPGILLGNGDTLEAGVYQSPALTTLNGLLYLDALGDSNAVFIFQIQAAFSSAVAAKIQLLNGAQACNVFWKVEGVVSLAADTYFQGTLIANNAAINMSTNDTLVGRALSTTGAVNVNAIHAATPLGCGTPILTGPAAPNLASAACYSIFSGNGAVANSGTTYVTGDVGTNVGLTLGYNPLFINGNLHPNPDVSTATAAADLLNAYNAINVLPHDIELLFPAQFGNELVLTPHVYLMNAATALNGTVYLNAQGNTDAVFVIKINGALSTSTFAKVVLQNGAQADNVYWKVDGAVSAANYAMLQGTIIANNAAIDLTTGDTLYGRVLTTNGALSTADNYVVSPSPCGVALPLTWQYFTGKEFNARVLLEWATANAVHTDFYTVEKSSNGIDYKNIRTIKAQEAGSKEQHEYNFVDAFPFAITYYRIMQTDLDGLQNYSKTITVQTKPDRAMEVAYVQIDQTILIKANGTDAGVGKINLLSMDGKVIQSKSINLTQQTGNYYIETPATAGIFIIQLIQDGSVLHTGKISVH